ncbi:dual specificity protein phosphatase CDC14AB-like [Periophthalmus magnuspinnatus]|uniref:dual specificity protein phosphatase CDC14AB-like n=1 Tax=Periophthalmus magnuspinnatus TaxID=409849 RepID=UPI0024368C0E|nr:dual specificity protein phosphatase CDC14AB-like [Periophthalmus magnuspinnatus]
MPSLLLYPCVRCPPSSHLSLWLMGDTMRSQKSKMEDRGMSHLISSLDELNLNPINAQHNANLNKSLGPERIMESDMESAVTQGDKLRALKSRRPPRPATTGALR